MPETTSNIKDASSPEKRTVSPSSGPWEATQYTAVIVLADGTVIKGVGAGFEGTAVGEVCFNTAMTGYQEILTDPSYAGQIITFTFPHIGNIGTNEEDTETSNNEATNKVRGCILRSAITNPSNYRSNQHFESWLKSNKIIAITNIDTRALTSLIREKGMQHAVIAHNADGAFDIDALKQQASNWDGIEGADLAKDVTVNSSYEWRETKWVWDEGYGNLENPDFHVVALDCGTKRNIFRCLASVGCKVTVMPASSKAEDILAENPDGIFISNGPGDPAATGEYAAIEIKKLVESGKPIFGICLGHQILALALGAETAKMQQGHHGANHPVKDHTTGKVEITSMNHGFTVNRDTLPETLTETHISLFDGTNCGIRLKDKPVFSVQYHPEASPGPQDSHYLFRRFVNFMRAEKNMEPIKE
ncbi:MAG: glutamine-hydrolyzing carbamoyl-phosphate synthase small subunit [Rhodomicrobiaceae bacterium]